MLNSDNTMLDHLHGKSRSISNAAYRYRHHTWVSFSTVSSSKTAVPSFFCTSISPICAVASVSPNSSPISSSVLPFVSGNRNR